MTDTPEQDEFETLLAAAPDGPDGVIDPYGDYYGDEMGIAKNDGTIDVYGDVNNASKLLLMIHGFDLFQNHDPGLAFVPAILDLHRHFQNSRVGVISTQYNTHESFLYGARQVRPNLEDIAKGRPIVLFGYSMGGLVARQMVVDGLANVETIYTFCTPHLGTAGWVPHPNRGAASMGSGSQDLRTLLNHPTDRQRRAGYTFMGLCYQEAKNRKWHMNDGVVQSASQTCGDWRNVPRRHMWKSLAQTTWATALDNPHGKAQETPDVNQAFSVVKREVKA